MSFANKIKMFMIKEKRFKKGNRRENFKRFGRGFWKIVDNFILFLLGPVCNTKHPIYDLTFAFD